METHKIIELALSDQIDSGEIPIIFVYRLLAECEGSDFLSGLILIQSI